MALVAAGARPGGAAHFTFEQFAGWDRATPQQLGRLEQLVVQVLEPARVALGMPIVPTSWILGTHAASSMHPSGAAADVVAGSPLTKDATFSLFSWLARRGGFGELIYEQPKTGATGHVHVTLPGFGGTNEVLYERADGRLLALDPFSLAVLGEVSPDREGPAGSASNPLELEGIDVTVSRWGWLVPYLIAGGVAYAVYLSGQGGGRGGRSSW